MPLICIWILFDTHDTLVLWFNLGDYVVQFFITIINHYSTYFGKMLYERYPEQSMYLHLCLLNIASNIIIFLIC